MQLGFARKEQPQGNPCPRQEDAEDSELQGDHEKYVGNAGAASVGPKLAEHRENDEGHGTFLKLFECLLVRCGRIFGVWNEVVYQLSCEDGQSDLDGKLQKDFSLVDVRADAEVKENQGGAENDSRQVGERRVENGRRLVSAGSLGEHDDRVDCLRQGGADDQSVGQAGRQPTGREQEPRNHVYDEGHEEEVEALHEKIETQAFECLGEFFRAHSDAGNDWDDVEEASDEKKGVHVSRKVPRTTHRI